MLKAKHYSDSGHGWLAVKRDVLAKYGLLDRVTAYSYQSLSGQTIYLEEDADANMFLSHLKTMGVEVQIQSIDSGEYCSIRAMPRFQAVQNETP